MVFVALLLPAASDPPPTPAPSKVEAELAEAFAQRLQAGAAMKSLTFELFTPEVDTAFVTLDGETAVLWLALRDDAGRILAAEPVLALARRSEAGWQVLLPGDHHNVRFHAGAGPPAAGIELAFESRRGVRAAEGEADASLDRVRKRPSGASEKRAYLNEQLTTHRELTMI